MTNLENNEICLKDATCAYVKEDPQTNKAVEVVASHPLKFDDTINHFSTFRECLECVARTLGCHIPMREWEVVGYDSDDGGLDYEVEFAVLESDNSPADDNQIEAWRRGEMELLSCKISVSTGTRKKRKEQQWVA